MSDITDITRDRTVVSNDRPKTPKLDQIYKFSCSGIVGGERNISGMHVEWNATFNKPLEQLIYPSLQRFDLSNHDEKRKIQQKLHGHYDSHFSSNSKSSTNNHLQNTKQINANDVEFIALDEQKMFLHTPTWTMKLTKPKDLSSSYPNNSQKYNITRTASQATNLLATSRPSSPEIALQKSIESFQNSKQNTFNSDPSNISHHNTRPNTASTMLSTIVNNYNEVKPVYESFGEEIDIEGEKYLRRRIKEKYQLKLRNEQAEREFLAENELRKNSAGYIELPKSPVGSPLGGMMRRRGNVNGFKKLELESADLLYASISRSSLPDFNISPQPPPGGAGDDVHSLLRKSLPAVGSNGSNTPNGTTGRVKLNQIDPEEYIYNTQKKHLKDNVPKESDHLLDGLLYYRMHNELNRVELEEKKAMEQQKMHYTSTKVSKKFTNTFTQRLSHRNDTRHSSMASKNINEMHALRNEDMNLIGTDQLKAIREKESQEIVDLTRVRRAVGNQHAGYSNEDIVDPGSSKYLKDYTYSREIMNPETRKRQAQDKLLLLQLDANVLPETFIKPASDPEYLSIDLSNYGIGDTRGLCLGNCIGKLDRLQSLGLADNRLTSASIPTIIKHLHPSSIMHIDLSFNLLHDHGAKALATFFRTKNILSYLDISNCGITCADIKIICSYLISSAVGNNALGELYLSNNKIGVDGASALCAYLSSKSCLLTTLDLSWNNIAEQGAIEFSGALSNNTSMTCLNLASNGMNDTGGQRFAKSIGDNKTIIDIDLSQNNISNCTCFVVAQVLKDHPSMQKLNLSLNPLGEAGSRSIFRTILRGLRCFVTMRGCSYNENVFIFNNTYPALDNPYILDMSEPYKAAVLNELIIKVIEDPNNCQFENMTYRELQKGPESSINLVVVNKQLCLKSTGEVWIAPTTGFIKFNFQQSVFVPTLANAIEPSALNVLQIIVENGRTEVDRKQWLQLLCQDIYFTTAQARSMVDRFKKNKTIGLGGLTVLDILKSLWKFLLDTENMFDFLFENADVAQRRDLLNSLTLKRFKFNWKNPTGHWRLNLEDKEQRSIMMQIIAINNSESEFSKVSGRGDTSQTGNWFNFRNEKYTIDRETVERVIDKDFIKNVPTAGTIEFDYVSTTRPYVENKRRNQSNAQNSLNSPLNNTNTNSGFHGSNNNSLGNIAELATDNHNNNLNSGINSLMNSMKSPMNMSTPSLQQALSAINTQHLIPVEAVNDDNFYIFMEKLSLNSRTKISTANAMFILLDLQLAVTKYYFTVKQVQSIIDAFVEDCDIQSKVIVCLFSRIIDLHRMDMLIRYLKKKAQQDLIKRIGCLNLMNPLKISFDYVFHLKYLDNRILLVALMELASIESADQIIEDPTTELPIATMYGAYTRALNETRNETMRFTYSDFGVRTNNINWASRRDLIKKFLVGSQPLDESMYQVIQQYKELEAANALTQGPIDLQYGSYQKSLKSTPSRANKTNRQMVSLMRNVASTFKKT